MRPKYNIPYLTLWFFSLSFLIGVGHAFSQEGQPSSHDRGTLLRVAREYIQSVSYCALVTVDDKNQPHVRTMDPFPPQENMVVWLGTNRKSRKVQEIKNNPNVSLYYADEDGVGYVAIMGTAKLVDNAEKKAILWKEKWEQYYKDKKQDYLLIQVIPKKLEIVNYKHEILGDPDTWKTPSVEFEERDGC